MHREYVIYLTLVTIQRAVLDIASRTGISSKLRTTPEDHNSGKKPNSGVLKISLAGANNSVPTTGLTPCIIIIHVYTCNYSGARKNIDAR